MSESLHFRRKLTATEQASLTAFAKTPQHLAFQQLRRPHDTAAGLWTKCVIICIERAALIPAYAFLNTCNHDQLLAAVQMVVAEHVSMAWWSVSLNNNSNIGMR